MFLNQKKSILYLDTMKENSFKKETVQSSDFWERHTLIFIT